MKKHSRQHHAALLLLGALLCFSPLPAQEDNMHFRNDSTCGCDILFIEGIETTRDNGLYGFRSYDGTVLTPNIYKYTGRFTSGYCQVWIEDTAARTPDQSEGPLLCGLIDSTGRQVVPCEYTNVELPACRRILVSRQDRFGYTDLDGNIVIPLVLAAATPFAEGLAPVRTITGDSLTNRYSFIDTMGREVLPPAYDNAGPFSAGFAPVSVGGLWGIVDTLGNIVVPIAFPEINIMGPRYAMAGYPEANALFILPTTRQASATATEIAPSTPFIYTPITAIADNRIGVMHDEKQGFLDLQGREAIPCQYDEIGIFRLGRTMVRNGDLYGIIDTLGDTILPIAYHNRVPLGQKYVYHDSLALVEQNGLLGFVDLQGNFVMPLLLQQAYHFSQGLAAVRHDDHWGYINTRGDIYLPIIFDYASPFRYDRAEVSIGGVRMKIDLEGRCVKNCHGVISFR